MCWVNALSLDDMRSYRADAMFMNFKTEAAYRNLMFYIRRFGSAPADDRTLVQLLGVTVRYWRERAWPLLQDFFELRDNRIYHPDVKPLRISRPSQPTIADSPAARRQSAARAAANARWGIRSPVTGDGTEEHASDADAHASAHASGMRSDAETHVFSMLDASKMHAEIAQIACVDASGAYASPRAPSLSLSSFSPSDSSLNPLGEREDARACADASNDAPTHASGMRPDAITQCVTASASGDQRVPQTTPRAKRTRAPISSTAIAPDWKPSPEGEREARRRGFDPDELAEGFRNHYLGNGELRADWQATFLGWCRREAGFRGKQGQGHLTMAIPGRADAALPDPDQKLRALLTTVATMRSRCSRTPIAPTMEELKKAGTRGLEWLGRLVDWEKDGFRGETPASFQEYVRRAA